MLLDSRGSSVELVSSILTVGLRTRLPSLPSLTSLNSGWGTSESESDDAYVLRTRSTMSPQTSVLSLLSLKRRAGKLLTISGASVPDLHIFSGYRFLTAYAPAHAALYYSVPQKTHGTRMHTKGKPSVSQYEPQPPSDQNGYFRCMGYAGTDSASTGLNSGLLSASGPAQFLLYAYLTNIRDALPILPFNEHR